MGHSYYGYTLLDKETGIASGILGNNLAAPWTQFSEPFDKDSGGYRRKNAVFDTFADALSYLSSELPCGSDATFCGLSDGERKAAAEVLSQEERER